jgi:hypothetical protein
VALSRHRESTAIYTDNESAFVLAASRENRQESALDFAERHDLTLVSDHQGDVLDRILSGQVVSEEIKIDRVSSISTKEAADAKKVFDAELKRRIAELTAKSRAEQLAPVQSKLDELNMTLRRLMDNEPQPGLFKTKGFKDRVVDWEHQRQVKEAERQNVFRQIESIRSGSAADFHQEKIAHDAKKLTTQSLPKESELIANYKADKKLVKLTGELSDINKQLVQARERGDNKVIPRLLNKQSSLLSTLHHKKRVNSRLSDKQKGVIIDAKRTVDKELKLIRGRDRGLGLF